MSTPPPGPPRPARQIGQRVAPPVDLPPPMNARRVALRDARQAERRTARWLAFGVTFAALVVAGLISLRPPWGLPPQLAGLAAYSVADLKAPLAPAPRPHPGAQDPPAAAPFNAKPLDAKPLDAMPLDAAKPASVTQAAVPAGAEPPAPSPIGAAPAVPHPNPPPAPARLAVVGTEDRPRVPGQLRQITQDRCCGGVWWSPDSKGLDYIDRPAGSQSTAVYRVPLWPPGSPPAVVDLQVAEQRSTERFVVRPDGDRSIVRDVTTGREWPLATGGNPVRIAPNGSQLVWWDFSDGRAQVDNLSHIHTAAIDGTGSRELTSLWGAEVSPFLPDNRRVLVYGRTVRENVQVTLATLDVLTGNLQPLAQGAWLGDVALSPDGRWVVYTTSLDRADPDKNGIWIVGTDGGAPRKLPFVGAFRWRDGSRLLYVPMDLGAAAHTLWQYDAPTGKGERVFDPARVPMRIANNDWSVSPDGLTLAFVAEEDRDVWVVDLP